MGWPRRFLPAPSRRPGRVRARLLHAVRGTPTRWTASLIVGLLIAAAGIIAVLRVTGSAPRRFVIPAGAEAAVQRPEGLERMLALHAGVHLEPGNRVRILLNGDGTYPPLWSALRGARRTITLQSYYSAPGGLSDTLAAVLIERARSGVRVLLLLDAFGSEAVERGWVNGMRDAGVEVGWLRPLRWHTMHSAGDRSHVRAVVVDGRIGFTGGFGFADYWQGDGRSPGEWRESNVAVEGPAVAQVQATFAAGWLEATGELLTGDDYYGTTTQVGSVRAAMLFTAPSGGSSAAERFLALAILGARERLYISNSYFVPTEDFLVLLERTAARGVDVRILTAGPESDISTTRFASRRLYERLLAAGVRIHEYAPSMMHAKTFVVDGRWGTIGSMNFDNRSLAYNDESNLVVMDDAFGAELESVFLDDLRRSKEITLAEFSRRPLWERVVERVSMLMAGLL